jgi:hypothetical protein
VPIPTPAKQEDTPFGVPIHSTHLPSGTIPKSPGPLQIALHRETSSSDLLSDTSPARAQTVDVAEPMPTPMPGTNQGFSDNDLAEGSQGHRRTSPPEPPSDYFNIPVIKGSMCTHPNEAIRAADRHYADVHKCDPTQVRCKHHLCEKEPMDDMNTGKRIDTRFRVGKRESVGTNSSSLNIEHIVFEDPSECTSLDKPAPAHINDNEDDMNADIEASAMLITDFHNRARASQSPEIWRAKSHRALQKNALPSRASYPQARVVHRASRASSPSRWGTQGSLYDGNGYGGTSSSNSTRLSTSSTRPEIRDETIEKESNTTASLARSCVSIARDYDNLEDAIRAYAALEARRESMISDSTIEDVVDEAREDVDLANKMADNALGA